MRSTDLRWLCKAVPGLQALPKAERTAAAVLFEKNSFPAGHTFFEQGEKGKKGVYFVARGTVARQCRDISKFTGLPMPGARKQNVITKGEMFGSLTTSRHESFTVHCAQACEVFCITGEALKKLPDSMLCAMQEHLDQDKAWHQEQNEALPCAPCNSIKRQQRSSSSSAIACSAVRLPVVAPRTDLAACKPLGRVPDRAWLQELSEALNGHLRCEEMKPHSPPSQAAKKQSADTSFRLPRMASTPSLAKGSNAKGLPRERRSKCTAVAPFLEGSRSNLC